jgi:hypothetical protein
MKTLLGGIKSTFMILYYMTTIAVLYMGLPFWNFYRYLCKLGQEKAGEKHDNEKA